MHIIELGAVDLAKRGGKDEPLRWVTLPDGRRIPIRAPRGRRPAGEDYGETLLRQLEALLRNLAAAGATPTELRTAFLEWSAPPFAFRERLSDEQRRRALEILRRYGVRITRDVRHRLGLPPVPFEVPDTEDARWLAERGIELIDPNKVRHLGLRSPRPGELEAVRYAFETIEQALGCLPTHSAKTGEPLRLGFKGKRVVRWGVRAEYWPDHNLIIVCGDFMRDLPHEYAHFLYRQGWMDKELRQEIIEAATEILSDELLAVLREHIMRRARQMHSALARIIAAEMLRDEIFAMAFELWLGRTTGTAAGQHLLLREDADEAWQRLSLAMGRLAADLCRRLGVQKATALAEAAEVWAKVYGWPPAMAKQRTPSLAPPEPRVPGQGRERRYLTPQEIEELGLWWRTLYMPSRPEGVPVLLPRLGPDEHETHVVGGGALGERYAFTPIRTRRGEEGEERRRRPRPEKPERPELSPEEQERLERLREERRRLRELRQRLEQRALQILEEHGVSPAPAEERERQVYEAAARRARELGTSPEGVETFAQMSVEQFRREHERTVRQAAQALVQAALEQLAAEEATGQALEQTVEIEVRPTQIERRLRLLGEEEVRRVAVKLDSERAVELARAFFERHELRARERAIEAALRRGEPHVAEAIEARIEPLPEEEVRRRALERQVDVEKIRWRVRLLNLSRRLGVDPELREAVQGVADVAVAFAGEATGKVPFGDELIRHLGPQETAKLLAHFMARELGEPRAAAERLRDYIAAKSHAVAAAAVERAEDLLQAAERAMAQARQAAAEGGESLLSGVYAWQLANRYWREAREVCARALGGLEMAAVTAEMLERGVPEEVTIAGRATEAGTRALAEELGLSPGDYELEGDDEQGWRLRVRREAMDKLLSPRPVAEWENEAELREIQRRRYSEDGWLDERGRPWRPQGVNENIILRPWQQADVKLWELQKGLLIGDEVGTGKTCSAYAGIAHLMSQGKVKRALIIAPAGLVPNWRKEAEKFLAPELARHVRAATGSRAKREQIYSDPDAKIVIISQDLLRHDVDRLREAGFDALVVDEAHYFNVRGAEDKEASERARALRRLTGVPYKMLMTGTPVENDLGELHSLVEFVRPGLLGPKRAFLERFGGLLEKPSPATPWLLRQLQDRLRGVFQGMRLSHMLDSEGRPVLRMEREDVKGQPVVKEVRSEQTELSEEQRRMYAELTRRAAELAEDPGTAGLLRNHAEKQAVLWAPFEHNARVRKLMEIVERERANGKGIIFASHKQSLDIIIEGLRRLGYTDEQIARIDSDTNKEERQRIKERFNDPNDPIQVIVATDAAREGLTLTAGVWGIHYDRSTNPAATEQREGRIWRRGQRAPEVRWYFVETDSPFDEAERRRHEKKEAVVQLTEAIASGDDNGLAALLARYLPRELVEEAVGGR